MLTDRVAVVRRVALGAILAIPFAAMARAADAEELAGTWTWSWKDGEGTTHRHILEVAGSGSNLSARERFDDLAPVEVGGADHRKQCIDHDRFDMDHRRLVLENLHSTFQ